MAQDRAFQFIWGNLKTLEGQNDPTGILASNKTQKVY